MLGAQLTPKPHVSSVLLKRVAYHVAAWLARFEFYEALIRVAVALYVKPGTIRALDEALDALITERMEVGRAVT